MLAKRAMYFYGKSSFLSNFYPAGFRIEGKRYATVEHYFQSQKTTDSKRREAIRLAPTPLTAKRMGRYTGIRRGWEQVKEDVMMQGLRLKFANPIMCEALLRTGSVRLIEDSPTDRYWGGRDGGRNRLGILLMRLRKELQSETRIQKK